jgi:glycosyltransferase involved in cell wall biosynthesis
LITYQPDHSLNFQMCLPNKLFEFLMAGVPVLTSPLDAVIEVFKTHNVGQILPSLASADIGAAINAILADPVALASMHRNALDAAQHEFNWEKENPKLIRFYYEIQSRTQIE